MDAFNFLFVFARGRQSLRKTPHCGEQRPQSQDTVTVPTGDCHWQGLGCKSDKLMPKVVVKSPVFDKVVEPCGYLKAGSMRILEDNGGKNKPETRHKGQLRR